MRALAAGYRRGSFSVFHTPNVTPITPRASKVQLYIFIFLVFLSYLVRNCPDGVSGERWNRGFEMPTSHCLRQRATGGNFFAATRARAAAKSEQDFGRHDWL